MTISLLCLLFSYSNIDTFTPFYTIFQVNSDNICTFFIIFQTIFMAFEQVSRRFRQFLLHFNPFYNIFMELCQVFMSFLNDFHNISRFLRNWKISNEFGDILTTFIIFLISFAYFKLFPWFFNYFSKFFIVFLKNILDDFYDNLTKPQISNENLLVNFRKTGCHCITYSIVWIIKKT